MSTRTEEKMPPRFRLMNRNHMTIVLANGEKVLLNYNKSSYLSETFDEICRMTGVIDKDIFGLAQEINGFYHYLNLKTKISKINFKAIRKKRLSQKHKPAHVSDSILSSQSDSSNNGNNQGPTLHFRVKFYVRAHTLRDRQTKHQYYEQLRHNFLRYPFKITDEQALSLASLILQADYGPYHPSLHKDAYFSLNRCLPPWCLTRFDQPFLRRHLPALHAMHGRMAKSEAEFRFVRQVDAQPTYYNMHLFAALDRSTNTNGEVIWLGVSPVGLELYSEHSDTSLVHMSTLLWQQIKKITYKKRLVVVQVGSSPRELRLDAQSSSVAEHLFWLCREMHLYQITAQMRAPRSVDALDAQLAMRNGYRESYVYSDQADLQQHGSLGRGSHTTSRPSSAVQMMYSPDSSVIGNTIPRAAARKADASRHQVLHASDSKHPQYSKKEQPAVRPSSRRGDKKRRRVGTGVDVVDTSMHSSTPNLSTNAYLETDIDSTPNGLLKSPSPGSQAPQPVSSCMSGTDEKRTGPKSSLSFLKQRALSCDGSTTFLHPEVRRLQENKALSTSLPLLTQLCRDPDLVQLLGVHDDMGLRSSFNDTAGINSYNNNGYGGGFHITKLSNGFPGNPAPTAGMKSWRSEVLHLDRLTSDYEDDNMEEDGDSVLVRDLGGVTDGLNSAYSYHFRDNDYINLRSDKQKVTASSLA